jgi:hypothetical protein
MLCNLMQTLHVVVHWIPSSKYAFWSRSKATAMLWDEQ